MNCKNKYSIIHDTSLANYQLLIFFFVAVKPLDALTKACQETVGCLVHD